MYTASQKIKTIHSTFVDISAVRADFWMRFYTTVKQWNIHFTTDFCWNTPCPHKKVPLICCCNFYKYRRIFIIFHNRGTTTAEKLRETKVWAPTPGRPVLGAGGCRPLLLWGSGGITPGKFLKTHTMLNPAF